MSVPKELMNVIIFAITQSVATSAVVVGLATDFTVMAQPVIVSSVVMT